MKAIVGRRRKGGGIKKKKVATSSKATLEKRKRDDEAATKIRDNAGTFDEKERTEWLEGFRKRKRERRLRGLAHGALKDREVRLALRAERRTARQERVRTVEAIVADRMGPDFAKKEVKRYDDPEVVDQWGQGVTVTTTLGLDVEDQEISRKKTGIDTAQRRAGTLEAMMKKLAGKVAGSAKKDGRAARRRDRKAAAKGGKHLGPATSPKAHNSGPKGSAKRGGKSHVKKGGGSSK